MPFLGLKGKPKGRRQERVVISVPVPLRLGQNTEGDKYQSSTQTFEQLRWREQDFCICIYI